MSTFFRAIAWCLLASISLPSYSLLANNKREHGPELAAIITARLDDSEGLQELARLLDDYPPQVTTPLLTEFEKVWQTRANTYSKLFADESKRFAKTLRGGDVSAEIKSLRAKFHQIRALDEDAMKPKLKEVSWPAIERLRELLVPNIDELLAFSPDLAEQRRIIYGLNDFREKLYKIAVETDESTFSLAASEQAHLLDISSLDRAGIKILRENQKIASKEEVPTPEAEGVAEANLWRLLVGQNALTLDPLLCDASRGHSKDMEEHSFFAHKSPIKGRETPWDRARQAGTTASGENIYMGSGDPSRANRGWFFSPGHHKNMFTDNARRLGLGQHNSHWTQLLGR